MKYFLIALTGIFIFNSCKTYTEEEKEAFNGEVDQLVKKWGLKTEVTDTGLHYKIEKEGVGHNIKPTDKFALKFKGLLPDSTVFIEKTDTFKLHEPNVAKRVILGWREGLTYFNKGSKGVLIIPPHLGYAEKAIGKIPANSILIYEVEILDIW